jgi:WD repeat and SOF domain-containing protein 1
MDSSVVPIHTISIISGTLLSLRVLSALTNRWLPFDPSRNFPDLGPRFIKGERALRDAQRASSTEDGAEGEGAGETETVTETVREDMDDEIDLSWATVMKRSFEGYIRAERPNMYGEWLHW